MNKFEIYLAGKMGGLTFEEMNGWREEITKIFNQYTDRIKTHNPCHYYNFDLDPSTYTDHEVKRFDLWLVKKSNLVVVNLDQPNSIGTAIELHEAHDNWKIPVIGFGGKDKEVHPWMQLSLNRWCDDMRDAVEHVVEFYLSCF